MKGADELLRTEGLRKGFPGVLALDGVDFDVRRGEVHVLLGENGAGKSTLIKTLCGAYRPDAGRIVVAGEEVRIPDARAAERLGIAAVHQEFTLVPELSVAENLLLGRQPRRFGLVDRAATDAAAAGLLERVGLAVPSRTRVRDLGIAHRQMVEIAKALGTRTRVLIMDEPTAVLSSGEVDTLFRIVRELRADGVGVVFITHHLEEIAAVGDRVTVLRDGRSVGRVPADTPRDELVRLMVGRSISRHYPRRGPGPGSAADGTGARRGSGPDADGRGADGRGAGGGAGTAADRAEGTGPGPATAPPEPEAPGPGSGSRPGSRSGSGPVLLSVRGLTRRGVFREVSFEVRAGEVVGLAGLVGAGRSEVARAVFGADPYDAGTVHVAGTRLPRHDVPAALAAGIGLVPEDRGGQGLVLDASVQDNLGLVTLRSATRAGLVDRAAQRAAAERIAERLGVRMAGLGQSARTLSGGNQQKVVIGKWLLAESRVLILDEPTRGIDVGAKAEIYRLINDLTAAGHAVLMISSDLPEVLGMSDRVLVMARGRIAGELTAGEATQDAVMTLALGAPAPGPGAGAPPGRKPPSPTRGRPANAPPGDATGAAGPPSAPHEAGPRPAPHDDEEGSRDR